MAWPVYSEWLGGSINMEGWRYWAVPAGKRGVLKCIVAANYTAATADAIVSVAGGRSWVRHLPGTSSVVEAGMHVVVYAGQYIGTYVAMADGAVNVYGYLFDVPAGLGRSPMRELAADELELLPGGAEDLDEDDRAPTGF